MSSWIPKVGGSSSSSSASSPAAMAALRVRVLKTYKDLMRKVKLLDPQAQSYYYNFVRQQFNSHRLETDPKSIEFLLERAERDSNWILKKYNVQYPPANNTSSPTSSSSSSSPS
eukprot:TRINITY_DN1955_c0_g4_i2.p2 TRINITY_DN1955_c0_g4~~TRINITY_DN1955_c0_g4_i2.p2  ORF type:complete len:114 (+),score=41.75 TRINITY_DN1955_c0_g4_i2:119-460(+)